MTHYSSNYLNDNYSDDTGRGYAIQGYGSNLPRTYYYRDNMYTQRMQSQYCRIRGDSHFFWTYQEGQSSSIERYFSNYSEDGQANNYIALIKKNTSTNDSFYKASHGFPHNQQITLSITNSGTIRYFYDQYHNQSNYSSGTFYVDRIDDNRFRIKESTGSTPLKLRYATGTITFTGQRNNTTKYSFYICLLYTSPSPRDRQKSRMPSSA